VIGAAPGTGAARLALVMATRRVLGAGLDLLGVATLTEM
jgi:arginyl-tRNA synthetase